ncbi:hypothetical protein M885DRAFT_535752 [Pelagophyceae sp. CCMP2097]|nr:hypothetical protein M885DRAFT_535752 [Pelagophyceae sp. CCMP2097]
MAKSRLRSEDGSDEDGQTLAAASRDLERHMRKRAKRGPPTLFVEHLVPTPREPQSAYALRKESKADKEKKKQDNCAHIGSDDMRPWCLESYKPTAKMLKAECEKRVPRTRCKNWSVPECITFLEKNTAVVALNAGGGVLDARGLRRLSREERREDFDGEADEVAATVPTPKPIRWKPKDGLRLLHCIDHTREAFGLRGTQWNRAQKDDKELQRKNNYFLDVAFLFQDPGFEPALYDLEQEFREAGGAALWSQIEKIDPAELPHYEAPGGDVDALAAKIEMEFKKQRAVLAKCTANFGKSGGGDDDDNGTSSNSKSFFVDNSPFGLYWWLFLDLRDLMIDFQSDFADPRALASGETASVCSVRGQPRAVAASGTKKGRDSELVAAFSTPFQSPQDESAILLFKKQADLAVTQAGQIDAQKKKEAFAEIMSLKKTMMLDFKGVVDRHSAYYVRRIRTLFVQMGEQVDADECTAELVLAGLEAQAAAPPRERAPLTSPRERAPPSRMEEREDDEAPEYHETYNAGAHYAPAADDDDDRAEDADDADSAADDESAADSESARSEAGKGVAGEYTNDENDDDADNELGCLHRTD